MSHVESCLRRATKFTTQLATRPEDSGRFVVQLRRHTDTGRVVLIIDTALNSIKTHFVFLTDTLTPKSSAPVHARSFCDKCLSCTLCYREENCIFCRIFDTNNYTRSLSDLHDDDVRRPLARGWTLLGGGLCWGCTVSSCDKRTANSTCLSLQQNMDGNNPFLVYQKLPKLPPKLDANACELCFVELEQ